MTASDEAVQACREVLAEAVADAWTHNPLTCGDPDCLDETARAVADAVVQTEQALLKAEALHDLVRWAEANPEVRTHDAGDCLTVSLGVIRDRAYWVLAGSQSTDQERC